MNNLLHNSFSLNFSLCVTWDICIDLCLYKCLSILFMLMVKIGSYIIKMYTLSGCTVGIIPTIVLWPWRPLSWPFLYSCWRIWILMLWFFNWLLFHDLRLPIMGFNISSPLRKVICWQPACSQLTFFLTWLFCWCEPFRAPSITLEHIFLHI